MLLQSGIFTSGNDITGALAGTVTGKEDMTMTSGQPYNLTGIDMGDLEHKIIQVLFDLYFTALHDMNDPCCDHEVNAAIYATCRTVFADAGITDQVLDIFEYMFPGLESGQ